MFFFCVIAIVGLNLCTIVCLVRTWPAYRVAWIVVCVTELWCIAQVVLLVVIVLWAFGAIR